MPGRPPSSWIATAKAKELAKRDAEQARQRATEEQGARQAAERTARETREELDRERAAREATEQAANEAREQLSRERNAKNAALKAAAQLRRQLSQMQNAKQPGGETLHRGREPDRCAKGCRQAEAQAETEGAGIGN